MALLPNVHQVLSDIILVTYIKYENGEKEHLGCVGKKLFILKQ